MRMSDSLLTAARLLRPRLSRLLLAVTLGVLALSSALALAAVSAWLITRAWQMPPVLDLSVAVVMVRALAISRGVLHYCERLATHDTALRAAGSARAASIEAWPGTGRRGGAAAQRPAGEQGRRRCRRVGQCAGARGVTDRGCRGSGAGGNDGRRRHLGPAAAVLAACLLAAGVVAPYLAARATTAQETVARQHLSERDVAAIIALDHAPELRVGGALARVIAESTRRQRRWADVLDAAAKPAAVAEAMPTAAIGVSVLGAVVAGISMASSVAPTTLAILMLLPLSAFEATSALPGAAIQLTRSRIAARRLRELIPSDATRPVTRAATSPPPATARLTAVDISTAHPTRLAQRG
ncbi:putative cytochrome transmembrane ATP-binding protein ABC transporter CydC [Mycobacterium xenopi 3993]|nr:putative cytochrome transmembrane ATP-binding protein ABC transporter CydC [Mycobacterium xenopi 3993]